MSNSLLTPTIITREALRVLHGNLAFLKNVNKDYDSQFAKSGAKIGSTLTVRKPNKYTVRTGRVMNAQDQNEQSTTLTVSTQKGVDMNFTGSELALTIDEFSKRYIQPAMSVLAANVDADALAMTKDVYSSVGTPGTTPASFQVWADGMARLDDYLTPRDPMRQAILSPAAMARTVDGLKGLFQDGDKIADQYRNGIMANSSIGLKWGIDQNVINLTMGTRSGTTLITDPSALLVSGATQVTVDGFAGATDTVKQGEVFTIGSVYAVNAETKATQTFLQQFVVTADATAASNKATLSISPTIYTSGALQNVSALPIDNAAVTFFGTTSTNVYPQNLIFHRDAFTFATADLPMPRNPGMFAAREVMDGVSMRLWQGDDIINDMFPCRIDVLYGYKTVYPELAARVWG